MKGGGPNVFEVWEWINSKSCILIQAELLKDTRSIFFSKEKELRGRSISDVLFERW